MQCFRELSVFAGRGLSIPVVPRYFDDAENILFTSAVAIRLAMTCTGE